MRISRDTRYLITYAIGALMLPFAMFFGAIGYVSNYIYEGIATVYDNINDIIMGEYKR